MRAGHPFKFKQLVNVPWRHMMTCRDVGDLVGLLAAAGMMIGTWGTTTLLPTWIVELAGQGESAFAARVTGTSFMLANVGGVFGYLMLMWLNDALGRRGSYALVVVGCIATALFVFIEIRTVSALIWFMPL